MNVQNAETESRSPGAKQSYLDYPGNKKDARKRGKAYIVTKLSPLTQTLGEIRDEFKDAKKLTDVPVHQGVDKQGQSLRFLHGSNKHLRTNSSIAVPHISQLKTFESSRRGSRSQLPAPSLRRKSVRVQGEFTARLEGLKTVNDSKLLHQAEVDILQSMVINADCAMKDKVKRLDEVGPRYFR